MTHPTRKTWASVLVVAAAAGVGMVLVLSRSTAMEPPGIAKPFTAAADDKSLIAVSSESDGKVVLVGTELAPSEKPTPAGEKHPPDRFWAVQSFLAVQVGDKEDIPAEQLIPVDKSASVYRRWKEGDPLPAGKLLIVKETKEFLKLRVGDMVEEGQLLALVDPTRAIDEVAIKVARLEASEADARASGEIKKEAERREQSARELDAKGPAFISRDDYEAALTAHSRAVEEERAKIAGRRVAERELNAALDVLKSCEIRSPVRGVVKALFKKRGEAVKALETVVRIEEKPKD